MEISILLFDFILAIPLFFLLNLFEKRKNGTVFAISLSHIAISLIYLVFVTGILKSLGLNYFTQNIFLVVFLESLYRFFYITYVWNRDSFVNHSYYLRFFLLNLFSSYLLDVSFLSKVENVFLDANEMKSLLWLLILVFLYFSLKDSIKLEFFKNSPIIFTKKNEYIITSYAKLKLKYYTEISKLKNKKLMFLFYAIMVYENYQHPPVVRFIRERIFRNKYHVYGIMQIESSTPLTDLESIQYAMKKLLQITKKSKTAKNGFDVAKFVSEYYKTEEFVSDVVSIYEMILSFEQL